MSSTTVPSEQYAQCHCAECMRQQQTSDYNHGYIGGQQPSLPPPPPSYRYYAYPPPPMYVPPPAYESASNPPPSYNDTAPSVSADEGTCGPETVVEEDAPVNANTVVHDGQCYCAECATVRDESGCWCQDCQANYHRGMTTHDCYIEATDQGTQRDYPTFEAQSMSQPSGVLRTLPPPPPPPGYALIIMTDHGALERIMLKWYEKVSEWPLPEFHLARPCPPPTTGHSLREWITACGRWYKSMYNRRDKVSRVINPALKVQARQQQGTV